MRGQRCASLSSRRPCCTPRADPSGTILSVGRQHRHHRLGHPGGRRGRSWLEERGSTTSSCSIGFDGFRGLLLASLMQLRRLDGGRCGAAAWRPWPGDSGGRCDRLRRVAACFFGRNDAAEPCVASVPDCCAKNQLYGAVAGSVCVACAHLHH